MSCRRPDFRQVAKVRLVRRYAAEAAVWPAGIVKREILCQTGLCFADVVVGLQIDRFVLGGAPRPLDKDVITPEALAVHADSDAVPLERRCKVGAGELATVVGVEDLPHTRMVDRLSDGIQTEICRQGIGCPPAGYLPAGPIDYGDQIDESLALRNVGDGGRPDLIRPVDGEIAQEEGVDLVPRVFLAGIRFPVERPDAHLGHQAGNPFSACLIALQSQRTPQHPRTRQTQTPDATRRFGASAPGPPATPAWAASKQSSTAVPATDSAG